MTMLHIKSLETTVDIGNVSYAGFKKFVLDNAEQTVHIQHTHGDIVTWKTCAVGQYLIDNIPDLYLPLNAHIAHQTVRAIMCAIKMPYNLFCKLNNAQYETYQQLHKSINRYYSDEKEWTTPAALNHNSNDDPK